MWIVYPPMRGVPSGCIRVRTDAPARSAQGEARLGRSGAHAVEARQRHSIRRHKAKALHTAAGVTPRFAQGKHSIVRGTRACPQGGMRACPQEGEGIAPRREALMPPGGRHSCSQGGDAHPPRVETLMPPGGFRSHAASPRTSGCDAIQDMSRIESARRRTTWQMH